MKVDADLELEPGFLAAIGVMLVQRASAGRRSIEPPYVVGSAATICGHWRSRFRRDERTAPPEVTPHLRHTLRQRRFLRLAP